MKKIFVTGLLLGALLLVTTFTVLALGPAPSWQLTQAPADVCSGDNISIPGVEINAPNPASERGTLTAPGFPNLGFTQDTSFTGVGTYGFTVFTDPFVLPANTQLTLSVTTYAGANYTGGVAYVSTMTWDCTTGAISSLVNGAPVAACPNPLPSGSTIRNVPLGAPAYFAADAGSLLTFSLPAGNWWVTQTSGDFAQVWIACEANLIWIPVSALG